LREQSNKHWFSDAFASLARERASRCTLISTVQILRSERREARVFYLKFGFNELADDRRHLYLPVKVIKKQLGLSKSIVQLFSAQSSKLIH